MSLLRFLTQHHAHIAQSCPTTGCLRNVYSATVVICEEGATPKSLEFFMFLCKYSLTSCMCTFEEVRWKLEMQTSCTLFNMLLYLPAVCLQILTKNELSGNTT